MISRWIYLALIGVVFAASPSLGRNLDDSLYLHLEFESDLFDSSGHGNDALGTGSFYSDFSYSLQSGIALGYREPDGTLFVPPSPELNLRDQITVSLWIRPHPSQHTSYSTLFYKAAQTVDSPTAGFSDRTIALFWNSNGIHAVYTLAGGPAQRICADGNLGLEADVWHHVLFLFDAEEGVARLYVDNQLKRTCRSTPGRRLRAGNQKIGIGTPVNSQFTDVSVFRGLIDSVRLYGRALKRSEISALYDDRDGLRLHLGLDGNFADGSGFGQPGQAAGSLAFVPGHAPSSGQALDYNAADSRLFVTPSNELLLRRRMTISFWFNADVVQSKPYSVLLYKAAQNVDSPSVYFSDRTVAFFWTGGGIHAVYTLEGHDAQTVCVNENLSLSTEQWHQLTFVFNSPQGTAKVFIDNDLVQTCGFTPGTLLRDGNYSVGVGAPVNPQLNDVGNFLGLIDSVRIYNRVLKRPEIGQLFHSYL